MDYYLYEENSSSITQLHSNPNTPFFASCGFSCFPEIALLEGVLVKGAIAFLLNTEWLLKDKGLGAWTCEGECLYGC